MPGATGRRGHRTSGFSLQDSEATVLRLRPRGRWDSVTAAAADEHQAAQVCRALDLSAGPRERAPAGDGRAARWCTAHAANTPGTVEAF